MELFEAIKGRRSVRRFRPEPVDDEDLEKILEAAIAAPSAGNCQPWEFVVVKDSLIKQKLREAAHNQAQLTEAPVVLVVCANMKRNAERYGERGHDLYCIQDTAAAAQNIHLATYGLGYGTCWVGAFDERAVADAIRAQADVRPVVMIPIGRPAEKPAPRPRLSLKEISHRDCF